MARCSRSPWFVSARAVRLRPRNWICLFSRRKARVKNRRAKTGTNVTRVRCNEQGLTLPFVLRTIPSPMMSAQEKRELEAEQFVERRKQQMLYDDALKRCMTERGYTIIDH